MANPTPARLKEVSELLEHSLDGDARAQGTIKQEIRDLQESESSSDFPAALRVITQQAFLGQYAQIDSVYTEYTREYDVNNLRPQAYYSLFMNYNNLPATNGGVQTVTAIPGGVPRVPELTEFPTFSFSASEGSFGVAKYGARINFSFEMLLNDEWGVLETLPTQLAQLARNQEDIVATEVLASVTGPNPAFFNSGNANIISGAPQLSVDALWDAMTNTNLRTYNGNPVNVQTFALIVPPALEREAKRITTISSFLVVDDATGRYNMVNPVSNVNVIVNRWLPLIDKSANVNTTWYLVPYQAQGIRPSIVFSKIRGRTDPELRISSTTGQYAGGGDVPGREGSFLNDDIEFRVRHFVGAAGIAAETVSVSLGTASPEAPATV
jgi:hypothetical protein